MQLSLRYIHPVSFLIRLISGRQGLRLFLRLLSNLHIFQSTFLNKKSVVLLLLFFGIFSSYAQFSDDVFLNNYLAARTEIYGTANVSINSNAITNSFVRQYYKGGYFTDELKNQVLRKLVSNNRSGGDIEGGIYYRHYKDSLCKNSNISFFIALRERQQLDSKFSKDIFEMVFYGQKNYIGKTADFSNFTINILNFQQLQGGWTKKISTDDHNFAFGAALSLLKGEMHINVSTGKTTLFTEENLNYLDADFDVNIHYTDTLKKGIQAFNGTGGSIDLFFTYSEKTDKKIRLIVSDLGYIQWNGKSNIATIDTTFHFEGIELENMLRIPDSIINSSWDSLNTYFSSQKQASYKTWLFAKTELSFEKIFVPEKFKIETGLQYRFSKGYLPYFYVMPKYYFTKRFMVSATVSAGGYGNVHAGLALAKDFGKGLIVQTGSNYIEAMLFPSGTGQGGYFMLKKVF